VKARITGLVMAGLLLLYLVFVAQYAVILMNTGVLIAQLMGVALLVLPIIGGWALFSELRFVFRAERLLGILREEDGLPVDDLPRLPSGRIVPAAADARFPEFQAEVEAEPESWRAWFRLGLAYDASGDRKRARWATREAITLEKANPT
jgi:hypothetical protein